MVSYSYSFFCRRRIESMDMNERWILVSSRLTSEQEAANSILKLQSTDVEYRLSGWQTVKYATYVGRGKPWAKRKAGTPRGRKNKTRKKKASERETESKWGLSVNYCGLKINRRSPRWRSRAKSKGGGCGGGGLLFLWLTLTMLRVPKRDSLVGGQTLKTFQTERLSEFWAFLFCF